MNEHERCPTCGQYESQREELRRRCGNHHGYPCICGLPTVWAIKIPAQHAAAAAGTVRP